MSTLVDQVKMLDLRGHETNRSGERQNDRRRFRVSSQGRRGTLAGRRYDEFRNRPRTGSDCCARHPGGEESAQEALNSSLPKALVLPFTLVPAPHRSLSRTAQFRVSHWGDLLKQTKLPAAAILGRKGGLVSAKRGSDYFPKLAAKT
jgi:hypothetical protein